MTAEGAVPAGHDIPGVTLPGGAAGAGEALGGLCGCGWGSSAVAFESGLSQASHCNLERSTRNFWSFWKRGSQSCSQVPGASF